MMRSVSNAESTASLADVSTLTIDIGGTGLKASVRDRTGKCWSICSCASTLPLLTDNSSKTLADLVAPLPPFERISAGFPGVIRDERILIAPHFGEHLWREFPLADALSERLVKPVRLLNDAEVQG